MSGYICRTFYTIGSKFYIFIFQGHIYWQSEETESQEISYDKYVSILTIRYDHVNNHFYDKFVILCHVGYFINDDRHKLTIGYIYCTFYIFLN